MRLGDAALFLWRYGMMVIAGALLSGAMLGGHIPWEYTLCAFGLGLHVSGVVCANEADTARVRRMRERDEL